MVKVLIVEDNPEKLQAISEFVRSEGVDSRDIVSASTLVEFSQKLDEDVDVCVIDIRIPAYSDAPPDQNGIGILQLLAAKGGSGIKLLAISAYPEEFDGIRAKFERQGCILANYHEEDNWKSALRIFILQSSIRARFDFLIFVALPEERTPYTAFTELGGVIQTVDGLSRFDINIDEARGSVILLPRMGLVDAAITAGKCMDKYSPKLVAMSGICAGFEDQAELGQLLVSDLAYEYQSGKWSGDGFKSEPYQVPISEAMRVKLRHLLEKGDLLSGLESGWKGERPKLMTEPKLAVFTSGSAVIADAEKLQDVEQYHRKVSGLDMEVYAIHRAAHLASSEPDVVCAKVVVDLANKDKNDRIHAYGCYVSSRFVIEAIADYFRP